jgi:geranylgeranyl diphosphate synthase type II
MHIKENSKRIAELIAQFELPKAPSNLYEPIRYIMDLGGKRVRPVVAMQIAQYLGLEAKTADSLALSIELFHNFTLVHDDIMDKADTRRGKATVHHKWDENIGILSGDAMLIEVYKELLSIDSKHVVTLMKRFNAIASMVCEGQQYDMDFESATDVSEGDYLEMIRLKTAVLLGYSMQASAILMGEEKLAKELFEIGQNIGISFQIKDDLLDAFPPDENFGKVVGGDIYTAKKTILYLRLMHSCTKEEKQRIEEIYAFENRSDEEVMEVRNLMLKYKVPQNVAAVANDYQQKVVEQTNALELADLKTFLLSFSSELLSRTV